MHGAVEEVQEGTPFFKDGGLVFLLGQLIIDILKLYGLCVIVLPAPTDAVLKHAVDGDGLLCGARHTVIPPGTGRNLFDLFPFTSAEAVRQLYVCLFSFSLLHEEQSRSPPVPPLQCAAGLRSSYLSDMVCLSV